MSKSVQFLFPWFVLDVGVADVSGGMIRARVRADQVDFGVVSERPVVEEKACACVCVHLFVRACVHLFVRAWVHLCVGACERVWVGERERARELDRNSDIKRE